MKIKAYITGTIIAILAFAFTFTACDDDLNSVGNGIQPGGDNIFLGVDTFSITAQTIIWDSIYARTANGLLGEYTDDLFGTVKADFLSEFYCPEDIKFDENFISIDSVQLDIYLKSFIGDSISPMGLSIFEVNNPLERNFYTNIDPRKYCNMSKTMGRATFNIKDSPLSGNLKRITVNMDTIVGRKFYDEWKTNPSVFHNSESLKQFFPGIYITPTLGQGTLMEVSYTLFGVHYSYKGRNAGDTADSTRQKTFALGATPEVIQMNHVESKDLGGLLNQGTPKRTYLKTPVGAYTEITIPLNEIAQVIKKDTIVNSAKMKIKGFTEEEEKSGLPKVNSILCIDKDSVKNFFEMRKLPDNVTSFIVTRGQTGTTYNSFDFGNIGNTINHYLELYKDSDRTTIPDLKYLLIPVDITLTQGTNSAGEATMIISAVHNKMAPAAGILRTDDDNLRFSLIFSKYNFKPRK